MSKLSPRQQAILRLHKKRGGGEGLPPSVREIGEAVGLASSSTVHGHLSRLEKKDSSGATRPNRGPLRFWTARRRNAARKTATVMVPLVGKVTAGEPITAVENIEEYIPLPRKVVGNGKHFILSVQGDSMINAGILDEDWSSSGNSPPRTTAISSWP